MLGTRMSEANGVGNVQALKTDCILTPPSAHQEVSAIIDSSPTQSSHSWRGTRRAATKEVNWGQGRGLEPGEQLMSISHRGESS